MGDVEMLVLTGVLSAVFFSVLGWMDGSVGVLLLSVTLTPYSLFSLSPHHTRTLSLSVVSGCLARRVRSTKGYLATSALCCIRSMHVARSVHSALRTSLCEDAEPSKAGRRAGGQAGGRAGQFASPTSTTGGTAALQ